MVEEVEREFYDEDEEDISELSSSPSIPEGDIDFNFVYALHTFLATVEGQATSQKGDTLVLLDDSNSYWWLVRNIKDQSIGYLPAEHIETPSERLARLNKHRNVDNGASQEHDIAPRPSPKAPSKFSMIKGRKGSIRAVTFSPPTFIEYDVFESEDEYADEDNLSPMDEHGNITEQAIVERGVTESVQETSDISDSGKGDVVAPRSYSLTPKSLATTPNRPRGGSEASADSRASPGSDVRSHGQKESLGSLKSEMSAGSSIEDPEAKDKKKKGVFSGLFKRRSKREKSKPDSSTGIVDSRDASAGQVGSQPDSKLDPQLLVTTRAPISSLMPQTRPPPAPGLENLPPAVQEMRSSMLMEVDPVTAEMIDEPSRDRGPVDEVEKLYHNRLKSPSASSHRRSFSPDSRAFQTADRQDSSLGRLSSQSRTRPGEERAAASAPQQRAFVWTDAHVHAHMTSPESKTMHKNLLTIVTHSAKLDRAQDTRRAQDVVDLGIYDNILGELNGISKVSSPAITTKNID